MATSPTYASTPRCGSCQLANSDSTTAKDFSNFTPASAGTRVTEIIVNAGPTTNPGTLSFAVLVHDGSNARLLKLAASAAIIANSELAVWRFDNLILPTGYKLQAVARTTITSGGTIDFIVMGADLT